MRLYSTLFVGEDVAVAVAKRLVAASQWFQVEPRPDDWWEFTVKEENHELLEKLVEVSRDNQD